MKLSFKKYVLLDLMAVFFTYIVDRILDNTASAVGAIGGSDGPTAFFVANNSNGFVMKYFILSGMIKYIIVFLTLLLLYRPIGKIIKNN